MSAIEGADIVIHTASPFPLKFPKNEQELIRPAVEGTLAVLRACTKHKVKRVVITSSCAAIMELKPANRPKPYSVNETFWSEVDGNHISAYSKSKTLAERAAWEYQKAQPEADRFEIVTINPSLVMGPTLIPGEFSSGQVLKQFLTGEMPVAPRVQFPMVDIYAVARAHYEGAIRPEAANERFILHNRMVWCKDLADLLHANYAQFGYKPPTKELSSYCTAWMLAQFLTDIKHLLPVWGLDWEVQNKKSQDILGIVYPDLNEVILEMTESCIEHGVVPNLKDQVKK